MKHLSFLFLLLFCNTSIAQIKQGDWMINGTGEMINQTVDNYDVSSIDLKIALGYFITEQWMVGTGIGMNVRNTFARVENQFFGRFYFKDTIKRGRLYLEAKWINGDVSAINVGSRRDKSKDVSANLSFGIDFFLSQHLALESQFTYSFFNERKIPNSGFRNRFDYFKIDIGLQYFFRYKANPKNRPVDYREILSKGLWFIGGIFEIPKRENNRLLFIQNVQPMLGVFFKRNWAMGLMFQYQATQLYQIINIGFQPFSRYYINIGKKKKMFLELNTGYTIELSEMNQKYLNNNRINYGGKIGISNFISKDVSLDISYSIERLHLFNKSFSDIIFSQNTSGLIIGLQYFISKKKS